MSRFARIVVSLCVFSALSAAQPTPLRGAPELVETLDRLTTLGSLLMLGAHPDDENTSVIAYFARGRRIRTAYLSATRGEGGQNLIGAEQGALMGLIRTQELLAARRIDGGTQFFTTAVDFGYSKTPEETLEKWGRERLLSDIVRVVRRFRPDVIVARFPPAPGSGGHGQHTAVGHLGPEAFAAAADPTRFPEQIEEGLKPWRARRYYWMTPTFSRRMEQQEADRADRLRIETGEYDPVTAKSYAEIAGESRSKHRSQSMGTRQRKGKVPAFFAYVAGEKAERDLFDGIDTSWKRVPGGARVGALLARARARYRVERPGKILPLLLEAYQELERLDGPWARIKQSELTRAIELASGVWVSASAARWNAAPGSRLKVSLEALRRTASPLSWVETRIDGVASAALDGGGALERNEPAQASVELLIPAQAEYSAHPWLRRERQGDFYDYEDRALIGDPEGPPSLTATFVLRFGEVEIPIEKPVLYRWVDRAVGERERTLEITPPVAVNFTRANMIFPDAQSRKLAVSLTTNVGAAEGELSLEVPEGWKVAPASARVSFHREGQETAVEFELTPPAGNSSGQVLARFKLNGKTISTGMRTIEYDHIPIQVAYPKARLRVERTDVRLLSRLIGYIMGAGDRIPEALEQLGAEVVLLGEAELASADLSRFDAIVAGVRTLNTRPDALAARERLLDYVKQGGVFLMQYNAISFRRFQGEKPPSIGPYPLTPSRNRVTDERAEVRFVLPDHPLLTTPNRITAADFEGWVQERGLYFMGEWDERYEAPLELADPGEPARRGALLYARYGDGVYIFTGLSFFRQTPAGTPGAYRLLANLVSGGKQAVR